MADVNAPSDQTPTMASPVRADDQILPHIRWIPIRKRNCYLDLEKSQSNPIYKIAVDLLKNTNFFRAFTSSSNLPSIYIQQFWDTIRHDKKVGCYKCQLDEQWFDLTKETLREALQITHVNRNQAFAAPPSINGLIDFVNQLGYPKPRPPVLQILWGIVTGANIDYAERIWEEFTQSIHTFIEDKRNLSRHTSGKKRANLIVIPSVRFTKLIIHYLQRNHRFHPRPDSPLYLSNEEHVLRYLKFSAKGTKREIFGMPIPGRLITTNIREASCYQEYQENVAKHRGFLDGETRSTQDLPAPKPAKTTRKPQSTAQKDPPKPSISSLVTSTQPAPTSFPAKTQENKRKQATGTTDKPAKAKRIKRSVSHKTCQSKSSPKSVGESEAEEVGPNPNAQAKGQTGSDTSAKADGQARSNPNETSKGQAGSNPDEISEGQAGPDPALEKSINRDQSEELALDLAEARKKRKKGRKLPKMPHGSPSHQPPSPPPLAGPSGIVDDPILRHNVSKPLPLGGPPGQVTIQSEFFFNKDLEYLRYGSKGHRPALSISKMKAVYYPEARLEQMHSQDTHANPQCCHLNHLPPKDKKILTTAVNQWTRQLVIRQHVEDFQLGIESYQTQVNLTKPQWTATASTNRRGIGLPGLGVQDQQDESRSKYKVLDQEGRRSVQHVHVRNSEAFEDTENLSWQSAPASDHSKSKRTIESRAKRSSKIISLGHYSILLASSYTVKSKAYFKSPTHYPCVGFNSLVHSLRALSALRRSSLRTASTAAKPFQGDSLEFYLITCSVHSDQRGTVVLPTLFNGSEQR
nr:monodehydroascorbate reductase [Tanacetum cinerariifolium]